MPVPDAPSAPVVFDVTQRTLTAIFDPNGDGGSPIYDYELGYSAISDLGTATKITGYPPTHLSGLTPATTYYFWARALNVYGWSAWSAQGIGRTLAGARVNVGGLWKNAIPYVRVSGVWKLAVPYIKVVGDWKEGL